MSTAELAAINARLDTAAEDYNEALDTIWMLLAALLVFFMHAGFSLLEAGSVRHKNAQNILAKNLVVVTVGFLCWWATGYAFALGVDPDVSEPNKFIGTKGFFGDGFNDDQTVFRVWFFQGAFCATAATIVSGAMAERTQLKGFAIYTILMTAFVYPTVVYWGWSGAGWLAHPNDEGETVSEVSDQWYMDFAGSGIVHMVGGVGALCGAAVVGARKDRWSSEVDADEFAPHNVPFLVLGTFCLWFGWYGFNPGSTLSMHDKATAMSAGRVAVTTTLAPCVAGLVVFILRALVLPPKTLDVGGFCNGILAGLVGITAGCAWMEPWEAVIIGLVAGLVYQGSSMLLKVLKVDDVVDAFPVHGCCGLWGVLTLGIFGDPDETGGNGFIYGGDNIGVQIVGALVIALWVTAFSVAIFLPLRLVGALRMSDDFQDAGADAKEHSPSRAYANEGAGGKATSV